MNPMNTGSRSITSCAIVISVAAISGCFDSGNGSSGDRNFQQINLQTDTAAYNAKSIDTNLANPWGIAVGPTGVYWVADNHTGMATLYNVDGGTQGAAITVPGAKGQMGAPTGVVYNGGTEFAMPNGGGKALFLFAGEDGTISAWSSGPSAVVVADRSDSGSVYKGLAIAADSGKSFLYLADFRGRRIDVYNGAFQRDTSRAFADTSIPADFAPFNIALIGNELFVAYARQKPPDNEDDSAGLGSGFINVFSTGGVLQRRFASQGRLNSPWAMVAVPGAFGPFRDGIFVGNFGDGLINVYDANGAFEGQVTDANGNPLALEGLWALYFSGTGAGRTASRLYFTAGPAEETHGLFGYLVPQ
ncbi:MAG: hypothetical protein JWP91_3390 [Fibrobacteres bacterium]|nr:hypothetical protein [Fibrobacterota bacterium]